MLELVLQHFDLEKISKSGQCFRMKHLGQGLFQVIAFGKLLEIESLGNQIFRFYCSEEDFQNIWYEYFDLSTDYQHFIDAIPASDVFLKKASELSKGLRILKQDSWETLVSFILSQRKNIQAIKASVESLCSHFGDEIEDGIFSFPTAERLSNASIEDLNACSLGYRSKYILETAKMVSKGKIDLQDISALSDEALRQALCQCSGVGTKIANCVMLFAFYRTSAFPIDVWIERVLKKEYNNQFDSSPYKGFAGVMQQYMFYYAQHSEEYKNITW